MTKKNEVREWINTIVSILVLVIMILGLLAVNQLNINLKEIKTDVISTDKLQLLDENGTVAGFMYYNGTHIIISNPEKINVSSSPLP
jgi:hypothetical protein